MATEASVLFPEQAPLPAPPRRRWRMLLILLGIAVLLALAFLALLARLGRPWYAAPVVTVAQPEMPDDSPAALRRRLAAASSRLARLRPPASYIVVDTYANRLRLFERGKLIREAICSTGTGRVLKDPRNGRTWIFDTPLGERQVINKVRNPIWSKPDWAFIEEGFTPPPAGSPERFDDISLGDYGLYMGDGYIIHGTLFKTLLGRRVTHGCIRLGDEDLEFVYKHAPLGTRVYLY